MFQAIDAFDREGLGRQAHVWLARSSSSQTLDAQTSLRSILDPEEIERLERFKSPESRQLFLLSHALVRIALSHYEDIDPGNWRFENTEDGKPEIANPEVDRLRFNLSHTGGIAACVVTRDLVCGVDVERVGRVKDLPAVAKRVFAPEERTDLEARSDADRHARFTDYWTLKEATIKATGTGFKANLREIRFQIEEPGAISVVFLNRESGDAPGHWHFALTPLEPDLRLAVAIQSGSPTPPEIFLKEITLSP